MLARMLKINKRAALPIKWLNAYIDTLYEPRVSKSLFLDFVQVVLVCFFVSGFKSFAGCVHKSSKKCEKAQKSSKKCKEPFSVT